MDKKAAQIAVPPPTDPAFDASTPTSRKKIEANRRNAQLSTGPKSLEGKKIVAGNARKHGLLANNVVILTGDGKEDQAEFDGLLFQLHEYYKPVGVAEDLLVQEIAVSYWRSARALRCERGEVTLGSRIPLERSNLSEPTELSLEPQSDSDTRNSLLGTSRGLNYLLKKVEEARIEAKSTGYVSKESIKFLSRNSGQSWNGFSGKHALLTALEDEKADISARKLPLEEEELNQRNARLDSAALPGKGALDGIHRYETSNVRHRYKVEKRLQELQSRRQDQDDVSGAHNANGGER